MSAQSQSPPSNRGQEPSALRWLRRMAARLVLSVVFYVVVSPIALVLRLVRSDPLHRTFDDSATYRTASRARAKESLERPG